MKKPRDAVFVLQERSPSSSWMMLGILTDAPRARPARPKAQVAKLHVELVASVPSQAILVKRCAHLAPVVHMPQVLE